MSWKMLYNGNCPPEGVKPSRFVHVDMGNQTHIALDDKGRVYTWGSVSYTYTGQTPVPISSTPNYNRHPAIVYNSGWEMRYPYQVSNSAGWKNPSVTSRFFAAQDADGYIWGWGEGFTGQGQWSDTSQYANTWSGTAPPYTPGGSIALWPVKVGTQVWLDFRAGDDIVLAISADNRVYVWGRYYSHSFGMPGWTNGQKSFVPLLVNTMPDKPVKLIATEYNSCIAITEDNEAYVWGDSGSFTIAAPTLVPLSLSLGVSIIGAAAGYSGYAILLSDGRVYTLGYTYSFTDSTQQWHLVPGGHNFVHVDAYDTSIAALDSDGTLWGWGNANWLISRDDTFCDQPMPTTEPILITNRDNWITFSVGERTHAAINSEGELWTWGSDLYGGLGWNIDDNTFEGSCSVGPVAHPTLADGTNLYEEVNAGAGVLITRVKILPQLRAHDPCGHWHKGLDSAIQSGGYPENCWEPTIATDGTRALYVICGRHRPNEILMLNYQIAQNTWSTLLERQDVLHSNWDGGAALAGDVSAFHNYAYDISGEQYQEITSNPRMRTYVVNGATVNITNWSGTSELNGRNKIAVTATGAVACIVRSPSTWQVHGSSNSGATYSLLYTLPGPVTDAAILFDPQDGLIYVAVVDSAADALRIYSGTIAGAGWTLKSTTTVVDAPQQLRFHVDNDRYFATIRGATTRFYYSTNNCSSFLARDLQEQSLYYAATGTNLYNLGDQRDYYTDDYEQAVVVWHEAAPMNTPTERCTLHNFGNTAVFSQATLRNDSGNVVTLLISFNLGREWKEISTPLNYYETFEEILAHGDSPVWAFTPQWEKI